MAGRPDDPRDPRVRSALEWMRVLAVGVLLVLLVVVVVDRRTGGFEWGLALIGAIGALLGIAALDKMHPAAPVNETWLVPLLSWSTAVMWVALIALTVRDNVRGDDWHPRTRAAFWVAGFATVVGLALASLVYPAVISQELTRALTFTIRCVLFVTGLWGLAARA